MAVRRVEQRVAGFVRGGQLDPEVRGEALDKRSALLQVQVRIKAAKSAATRMICLVRIFPRMKKIICLPKKPVKGFLNGSCWLLYVLPKGIEPLSSGSKPDILSVELRELFVAPLSGANYNAERRGSPGDRTQDLILKRDLLYQLS